MRVANGFGFNKLVARRGQSREVAHQNKLVGKRASPHGGHGDSEEEQRLPRSWLRDRNFFPDMRLVRLGEHVPKLY